MVIKKRVRLILTNMLCVAGLFSTRAWADEPEKVETSDQCSAITLEEIPVADLNQELVLPLVGETRGWRRTQRYNTKWSDPDCYKPGHNGTDVGGEYGVGFIGEEEIRNVLRGKILISRYSKWWGESVTVVSRINEFSEELITISFHHLDVRYFAHCEPVFPNELIGMEGKSGDENWDPHLHFTVRYWANLDHLMNWLGRENGAYHVFGQNAYFGHDGARFRGSYNPGAENIKETSPYYNYGHLDPEKLLFNYFLDYNLPPGEPEYAYFWSKPYALKMRQYGFYMGDWRGNFGAQTPALRREVARWLKIAAERPGVTPLTATFDDVEQKDPDSPYIEALTRYPAGVPVVNPDHTCDPAGHNFCPDNEINRAEALKMVVLAFYHNMYLKVYEDDVWNIPKNLALQNVMLYEDVSPYDWYASYVYFGTTIGLVENQQYFNPDQPVMKEEMAKWIITSYELAHGVSSDPCAQKVCATGQYCDPDTVQCVDEPTCVPSETQECEVGGGYIPDECDGNQNPVCTPGETKSQPCGNGGTQNAVCTSQCMWSDWGDCLNQGACTPGQTQTCGDCGQMTCQSDYTWSACQGQGVCTPGETQSQTCNYTGTQTQTCLSTCAWSAWSACSVQTECTPGQTQTQNCTVGGQPGTQTRTCDAYGQWGTWSGCQSSCECSSGICCDGCYYRSSNYECDSWNEYRCEGTAPGDDAEYMQVSKYCSGTGSYCSGQTDQTPWYTLEFCSGDQQCVFSGSTPTCEDLSTCTDTYYPSSKIACFDQNPNGVEICLSLQRVSGSNYKFRVCKTGTFQNNFSYKIKDILNPSHSPVYTGTGSSGVSCTEWESIDFSYIPGYGIGDGASIRADVRSPVNEVFAYRSAAINVYKQCL